MIGNSMLSLHIIGCLFSSLLSRHWSWLVTLVHSVQAALGFRLFVTLDGLVSLSLFFQASPSAMLLIRLPVRVILVFLRLSVPILSHCPNQICVLICVDLFMKRPLLKRERSSWAAPAGCLQGEVKLPCCSHTGPDMVQLQYILSTRAQRSHSDFSQERVRGGLMVDYRHRPSPHSIRDLLEPWVTSSLHVVLSTEPMLEFQQSLGSVHIVRLSINSHDLPGECNQICIE